MWCSGVKIWIIMVIHWRNQQDRFCGNSHTHYWPWKSCRGSALATSLLQILDNLQVEVTNNVWSYIEKFMTKMISLCNTSMFNGTFSQIQGQFYSNLITFQSKTHIEEFSRWTLTSSSFQVLYKLWRTVYSACWVICNPGLRACLWKQ